MVVIFLTDLEKTQHYSVEKLLLDGLFDYIPEKEKIIEPFYGNGDLVKNIDCEYYDIDFPPDSPHHRDTLLNPPDYNGKYVITNPPYLAKNKAKDKKYFEKYQYDDLYKIAIHTILAAEGGILIVPINFIADERSKNIRKEFFEKFSIERLNIYLDGCFENTNYNVCSFAFRKQHNDGELVKTFIYKDKQIVNETVICLLQQYDYRLGGEFFYRLKQVKTPFSRLTLEKPDNPTNINIVCIDKTNEPLHFYYSEEPYYGKQSDRNLATLSFSGNLSKELQLKLIEDANYIINDFRKSTFNLCLTNYRDRSRKRIGFTEAYQIMGLAYQRLMKGQGQKS